MCVCVCVCVCVLCCIYGCVTVHVCVFVTASVVFTHNWLYQMNVIHGEGTQSKSTIPRCRLNY